LVSSINWSLNSPLNNREVGLILDHPAIGQYYTDILMTATRNTQGDAGWNCQELGRMKKARCVYTVPGGRRCLAATRVGTVPYPLEVKG
ncbi:MAG: hypothetical protein ACOY94_06405, partial [Bacillota bacterium]